MMALRNMLSALAIGLCLSPAVEAGQLEDDCLTYARVVLSAYRDRQNGFSQAETESSAVKWLISLKHDFQEEDLARAIDLVGLAYNAHLRDGDAAAIEVSEPFYDARNARWVACYGKDIDLWMNRRGPSKDCPE